MKKFITYVRTYILYVLFVVNAMKVRMYWTSVELYFVCEKDLKKACTGTGTVQDLREWIPAEKKKKKDFCKNTSYYVPLDVRT